MRFNRQIGFFTSYELVEKVFAVFLRKQKKCGDKQFSQLFRILFANQRDQGNRKSKNLSEFEANRKILGGDVKQKKTGEMPVRKIKMTGQRSKLHRKVTRQKNKKFQTKS